MVMMGLRLTRGISHPEFTRRIGATPGDVFANDTVARLVDAGYLDWDDSGFRASPAGRQRLNAVVDALLGAQRPLG